MTEPEGGPLQPGAPYETLDGSLVTELVRPERSGPRNVSVAEAVVKVGQITRSHAHRESDEVYVVLSGEGVVTLGAKSYLVAPGSCLFLPAGQVHAARCDGPEALRILCICAPPYTHEQTTFCD